jgi:5,5'-dehydrodivanillate O-demethylase oxygenase subunit
MQLAADHGDSVDPYPVEFLHGYYFEYLGNKEGFEAPKSFQKKQKAVAFEEMEFGVIKRRLLEGQSEEDDDWKIGHPLVFLRNSVRKSIV